MGNLFEKTSNAASKGPNESSPELVEAFATLCSPTATLMEKRVAFLLLRQSYVPNTSRSKAYSEEVSRVFSLKFPSWELSSTSPPQITEANRAVISSAIRGIIFGCAVGDAAGLATEFLDKNRINSFYFQEIHEKFTFYPGCDVFPDSHRVSFTSGDWTDDTDQLLLALISLLETKGELDPHNFSRRLAHWRESGFAGLGDSGGCGLGKSTKAVIDHPNFLNDPQKASKEVWERSHRKLAPNGALMRTAITAIPFYWNLEIVQRNTLQLCTITHYDPRCQASCLYLCLLIAKLLQFQSSSKNNTRKMERITMLRIMEESYEIAEEHLIRTSQDLGIAMNDIDQTEMEFYDCCHPSAVRGKTMCDLRLDDGPAIGYTFKCLSVAAVALIHAIEGEQSFEMIMQSIIREGGDADTNAAVAGALLGAYFGIEGVPSNWITAMPYEMWLEAWVQKVLFLLQLPYKRPHIPEKQGISDNPK